MHSTNIQELPKPDELSVLKGYLRAGLIVLWVATYLHNAPVLLDVIYGAKKNPGAFGNLLSLLVFYAQIPGALMAKWLRLVRDSFLASTVTILCNALLYALLWMFFRSLRFLAGPLAGGARRASVTNRGVLLPCVLFFSINLASSVYLSLNIKRIECFDCDPHVGAVMTESLLSLALGAIACWLARRRANPLMYP